MSDLQHQRIEDLCRELSLGALAGLYGPIAQGAAKKKDVSYADFLEEVLRAERDARRVRSREMLTRTAGFPAIKTLDGRCVAHSYWIKEVTDASVKPPFFGASSASPISLSSRP